MQTPTNKPKRSTLSKILIGAVALILACCGLSAIAGVLSPSRSTTPAPTAVAQAALVDPTAVTPPTTAPQPTEAPTTSAAAAPEETAPAAPAQVEAGGGTIPGLQPADVTVNLKQRDFTCTTAEPTPSGNYYVWRCKSEMPALKYDVNVEVWGRTLQSVDYIDASVLQYGDDDIAATSILGFIATMPYDNAQPREAREWVATTMQGITGDGDAKETEFAGVTYRLYGPQTARNLEIGSIVETAQ